MKQAITKISLLVGFAMLFASGMSGSGRSTAAAGPDVEEAGVEAVATADGLTAAIRIPGFRVSGITSGGDSYDSISFEGQSGLTGDPGAPALPFYSFLIAAPADAGASIVDLNYESRVDPETFNLAPAPTARPLADDLTPGQFDRIPDPARYASGALYPAQVVEITGEAWIRGQRVLRIVVYPFQYDAAAGRLTVNSGIGFRIEFDGPVEGAGCSGCSYAPELEHALREQLVNYDQGLNWRVTPGSETLADQIQSPGPNPFLGPRFEIVVKEDGVYHLTYAALQAAGMDVDDVNPQSFRLVNQGQNVSIYVSGEGDASFDPGDFVAFYGERFRGNVMEARYESTMTKPTYDPEDQSLAPNNWFWQCLDSCELASYFERYTEDNVYYLIEGGPAGPRMSNLNAAPGGATIATSYFETVRAEVPIHWWSHEWHDDEIWFWERFQTYTPGNFPITLTNLAAGSFSATIHVELSSRSENTLDSPDHHSKLSINGFLFDDHLWDGRTRYTFTGMVPQSQLLEGANSLNITLVDDTTLPNPDMYFDFFEVTYARQFAAVNDQLNFKRSQSGSWRFQVTGLTSGSVEVYRINNPLSPVRITNTAVTGGGPFTATFQVTDGASSQYVVAGTGTGVLTPESITAYTPPDFASMPEVDYVLITHADFLPATQTLANYRASQGYSVAVIDIADLYREFNDGIYHPIAIKNFLAWTFDNWSAPVSYAGLVGNGNWNMRNFGDGTKIYHNAPPTYMPPNLAYVDPWQGEVDSSNLLATIIGNDTVPDVYIGRFPVNTNTEMATMVGKIIDYETAPFAAWKKNVLFIADNIFDPAGNFIALSEGIISDYVDPNPVYNPIRLYQDDGDGVPNGFDFGCVSANSPECNAMTAAIIDAFDDGALLVNYVGHASVFYWSKELIFINDDIPLLNNPTRLPFVLSMTCLDGHWTYPNNPSLVYKLLTTPGKGAVGTFSATGLGVATGHDPLQRGFYASLMEDGNWQAGPASTSGKLALWATASNQDVAQTFMIFGDPALGIHSAFGVSMTPVNSSGHGKPNTEVVHTLTVKNIGTAAATFDIAVTPGSWPATPSTTSIGPLNPNQTAQLLVTVEIPPSASPGDSDIAYVTASSSLQIVESRLTTIVVSQELFLPVIRRDD